MNRLYRALIRVLRPGTTPEERREMAATFRDVVARAPMAARWRRYGPRP